MTISINDIIGHLEAVAPPVYQESYDNSGLIVGDASQVCTGVVTCLDATEAVIDEAVAAGFNLVVAHHPIVFRGLQRFTGRTYVERVVMKAIRHGVAIYAIHTNLDNVYAQGVNAKIAERLGLVHTRILVPKGTLLRATVYCPPQQVEALRSRMEAAVAGPQTPDIPIRQAAIGSRAGRASVEMDVVFPQHGQRALGKVLADFPEVDVLYGAVSNANPLTGSGMVGELPKPMAEMAFLKHLKKQLGAGCVKYTHLLNRDVKTVALCGGAGGFLLPQAIASGAQVFVTADYKYHEYFDAESRIIIADVGHFESEQFTIELLATIIQEKFGNFAVRFTQVNTNPVNYL